MGHPVLKTVIVGLFAAPILFAQPADAQSNNGGRRTGPQRAGVNRTARPAVARPATPRRATPTVNARIALPQLGRRAQQHLAQLSAHSEAAVAKKRTAPFHLLMTSQGVSGQVERAGDSSAPAQTFHLTGLGPDGVLEAVGAFPVSGHVQDPQWGGRSRAEVDRWSTSDTINLSLEQPGDSANRIQVLRNEPSVGYGTQIPVRLQLKPGRNVLRYSRTASNGGTSEGSEPYLRTIVIHWDGN